MRRTGGGDGVDGYWNERSSDVLKDTAKKRRR
jgi:hypothetical protein